MSCSFLRDVPRLQNKNVSACRNRPRRFRLPTVGTITVGCQGLERSGKQKIFQALRNLEKFLRPLTANCYCATAPAHGRGSSFSRPRRAVCNTFPSPQLLLEHISCVTSFSQGVKKILDICQLADYSNLLQIILDFWPGPPETGPRLKGAAPALYICSGASTPMRASPFFSTIRVSSASRSRARARAGASSRMWQAV